VFSYKDNEGHITWVNLHGDPNFFLPENPKEIPSLKMLTGYAVRQQLIHMLNRQRRSSYHYKDFQAIQKDLYETYGLLYELSIWVLPSLNFPTAWSMDKYSPAPYLKSGEIRGLIWNATVTTVAFFRLTCFIMNLKSVRFYSSYKLATDIRINSRI